MALLTEIMKAALRRFFDALAKLFEGLIALLQPRPARLPFDQARQMSRSLRRSIEELARLPPRRWPGGFRAYRMIAGHLHLASRQQGQPPRRHPRYRRIGGYNFAE